MDGVINSTDLGITSAEFGRNCKSTGANDGTERNWFNGDGLRVRARTHLTSPNRIDDDYVWDQGAGLPQILQDVRTPNTGSASTTTYLYGLGLISETSSATSATSFYLSDGLGSTTELRDSSGAALNSYTYDVWGAIRTSTGSTSNQFDFTGQQTDHNANRGLQYLRARFYDPSLGRFLGRDPLPFVQRYTYAGDNPANSTDPTGMFPCPLLLASTGVGTVGIVALSPGLAAGAASAGVSSYYVGTAAYDVRTGKSKTHAASAAELPTVAKSLDSKENK